MEIWRFFLTGRVDKYACYVYNGARPMKTCLVGWGGGLVINRALANILVAAISESIKTKSPLWHTSGL